MNYLQHISQAMLKMGEQDAAGAEEEFNKALEAAKGIDPQGPREAEVLNYMALFYDAQGDQGKANSSRMTAQAIFDRFQER